jgi:adenosine kinase
VSLSFLVDDLHVRRGGVAANIAFGLGCLGLRPVLVGAVGPDFADYRSWLERHGVDCESVRVSTVAQTARFVCTTDVDHNQIASFYPGAMSEDRELELWPVAERLGGLDLVLIGATDPVAMVRHTQECRQRRYAFVADPSQQLARMDGAEIRILVEGAAYLFTNEYEAALTEQKTGWTSQQILDRVGARVTTLGKKGAIVERSGQPTVQVACPPEESKVDPTGVGDAFRAGYLAGIGWGQPDERCAQLGAMLATFVIETVGTQEYDLGHGHFLDRFTDAYGSDAAADILPYLRVVPA